MGGGWGWGWGGVGGSPEQTARALLVQASFDEAAAAGGAGAARRVRWSGTGALGAGDLGGPRAFLSQLGVLPLQGLPYGAVSEKSPLGAMLLEPERGPGGWAGLRERLRALDGVSPREAYAIGLAYAGPGQSGPAEILANESAAGGTHEDFEAFADALGWPAQAPQHAGLSPPRGFEGCPYWCDAASEALFLVAPRAKAGSARGAAAEASVAIVYANAARELSPAALGGEGTDVMIVVAPCQRILEHTGGAADVDPRGLYRVAVHARDGLPPLVAAPLVDGALLQRAVLPGLVRGGALAAAAAVRKARLGGVWGGAEHEARTPVARRRKLLAKITAAYGVPFDDETFMLRAQSVLVRPGDGAGEGARTALEEAA